MVALLLSLSHGIVLGNASVFSDGPRHWPDRRSGRTHAMRSPAPDDASIRFGPYQLHPIQGLSRGSVEVRVTPKALAVLQALAGQAGRVVT